MYLLLQRPTFIRYSLNSLTQWQVIGSFKLTEYPYEIKLLNIMLSVSILLSHTHTGTHSLLSPPKFYSLSSSWTGFLKIFFFPRSGSHQEMCQAEQLNILSICIRGKRKKKKKSEGGNLLLHTNREDHLRISRLCHPFALWVQERGEATKKARHL